MIQHKETTKSTSKNQIYSMIPRFQVVAQIPFCLLRNLATWLLLKWRQQKDMIFYAATSQLILRSCGCTFTQIFLANLSIWSTERRQPIILNKLQP